MVNDATRRRLAAILIADAVGYSSLMARDEERALALLKERKAALERLIEAAGGRVFGGAGDSVVAELPSAQAAVRCALLCQEEVARLNATSSDLRLEFRIGINIGDVLVEADNLFGDGVNICERLQSIAKPGGICISASVHDQVQGKVPTGFEDMGLRQLKNIPHAVHCYQLVPTGAASASLEAGKATGLDRGATGSLMAAMTSQRSLLLVAVLLLAVGALAVPLLRLGKSPAIPPLPISASHPTIAVLPFRNLSGDAQQDYLCDGLTDEIIAGLGRFSSLVVLSRNASLQYQGRSEEMSRSLGVRYLVDGSMMRQGGRIRVSASLTDAGSKQQLWSKSYDEAFSDIFAVEDNITRSIVGALAIQVSRVEQQRVLRKPPGDLSAYDLLLKGRALTQRPDRRQNLEARRLLEQAVALDGSYAPAQAALGWTYYFEATYGWAEFVGDALGKAESYAERTVALDPDLTEGHQLLAFVYLARREYRRAKEQTETALRLNPSDPYSYASLGGILLWTGDAKGTIAAMETALKLDPQLQWDFLYALGLAYVLDRRYEDAIRTLEPLADTATDFSPWVGLAAAYAETGRSADADRARANVLRLWPFFKVQQFVEQFDDDRARDAMAASLRKAGLR